MGKKRAVQTAGDDRVTQLAQALARVGALSLEPEIGPSKQLEVGEDKFSKINGVIQPPLNPETLAKIPQVSNILSQCIEAYEVNIDSHGYDFECLLDEENATPQQIAEMEEERARLDMLFDYFNTKEDFVQIRRKLRGDKESIGYATLEMQRNKRRDIAMGNHLPAHTVRLMELDPEPMRVIMRKLDKEWNWVEFKTWIRYRRFVQIQGNRKVYFKEFGDPREMSCKSGKYTTSRLKPRDRATEVIYFRRYVPGTPYGLPSHIGNLYSIYGSRMAEEMNARFFSNNMIPALLFLVAGGHLDEGSIGRIMDALEQIRGSDGFHKALIVQALSASSGASTEERAGNVRLEVKPLTDAIQKDALFMNYDRENRKKLRSAKRIGPMFTGESEDVRMANAYASIKVAEEQVFGPERNSFDSVINRLILADMGIKYWAFKSSSPDLTDQLEMARVMDIVGKHGGTTPNAMRKFMNKVLGTNLPRIEEPWADEPFQLEQANRRGGSASPKEAEEMRSAMMNVMKKALLDVYHERDEGGDTE